MAVKENERTCWWCHGRGAVTETTTEPDFATGVSLRISFGMGYFPSNRTVTKEVECTSCWGTGKTRF